MSYRSLKKVLGETNLERKCRILFGLAQVFLIGGAFWGVDLIDKRLFERMNNSKGRELVDTALYEIHWERFTTNVDEKEMRRAVVKELLSQDFKWKMLSTEKTFGPEAPEPTDPEEHARDFEMFEKLKARFKTQLAALPPPPTEPTGSKIDVLAAVERPEATPAIAPIFETRLSAGKHTLRYYQPVYWKQSCSLCHIGQEGQFAQGAGESPPASVESLPFTVVKISLPYDDTRKAISRTRAILITVGFITVVMAMLALWVIVRYVIVRPLNHLRDVSDAVSHGHNDLRAEIQTGDEFEDLATSFNKMLRHMVEAQGELRHVNKDLDAKVDELAQLNMRLYEMNRLKSDFLANMSHELRTPLNSIIGFSEVLHGIESLTDKQRRYAQNIQKSGRILLDMINDILDLAKLESGKMELRLSEFSIERVVQAQCDMVRSLTEEKNIDLLVRVESGLPKLLQDQGKIQQILTNLLSNAIKFTPEGGRITVGVNGTPQGIIELTVGDTGVGIAESDREIIFEKFRQGAMVLGPDNLTREFSGTGLGLSIVRELCKLLGGEVAVESELGRGSTFKVTFPWMAVSATKQSTPLQTKLDELARTGRVDVPIEGQSSDSESPAESAAS